MRYRGGLGRLVNILYYVYFLTISGWSPLHEACNRGNLSVAKLLIRHGALVNSAGMGKETPLHDAARNGHFQVSSFNNIRVYNVSV